MPKAVNNALKDVIMEYGQMSEQDAVDYLEKMERNRRYQTETWS